MARRIDRGRSEFPPWLRVVMDTGIPAGEDFDAYIRDAVSYCHALLVVIGPSWVAVTDERGNPKLEDPKDYVRIEIETALVRRREPFRPWFGPAQVIPVLINDTAMPKPEQLPHAIRELSRRQAVRIRDDRWDDDVRVLIEALRRCHATFQERDRDPPDPLKERVKNVLLRPWRP